MLNQQQRESVSREGRCAYLASSLVVVPLASGQEGGVPVDVIRGIKGVVVTGQRVGDRSGGDGGGEGLDDEAVPLLDVHERPVLGVLLRAVGICTSQGVVCIELD